MHSQCFFVYYTVGQFSSLTPRENWVFTLYSLESFYDHLSLVALHALSGRITQVTLQIITIVHHWHSLVPRRERKPSTLKSRHVRG